MFVLCIFSFYWELMSSVCRDEKIRQIFRVYFPIESWNSCTNLVFLFISFFYSYFYFYFILFFFFSLSPTISFDSDRKRKIRSKKKKGRKDIKLKISFVFWFSNDCLPRFTCFWFINYRSFVKIKGHYNNNSTIRFMIVPILHSSL